MRTGAAEFEAQDKKRKEAIDTRNEADAMVFQTEKAIEEVGDKLDANDKTAVEADLAALKEDGIRQIWHNAKLRGRGYSRAGEILEYAKASVGIREGKETGKLVYRRNAGFLDQISDE